MNIPAAFVDHLPQSGVHLFVGGHVVPSALNTTGYSYLMTLTVDLGGYNALLLVEQLLGVSRAYQIDSHR